MGSNHAVVCQYAKMQMGKERIGKCGVVSGEIDVIALRFSNIS